ncbi:MAG: hypothetical protein U0525_03900 [Patescibacteria group bacterium]
MIKRYWVFIVVAIALVLVYTRFVNLGWGLPYPMHPDERNMVDSITKIRCDDPKEFIDGALHNIPIFLKTSLLGAPSYIYNNKYVKVDCLNPQFFAYGQITLSLGYILASIITNIQNFSLMFLRKDVTNEPFFLSFSNVAIALRIISAVSSILNVYVITKIWKIIFPQKTKNSKLAEMLLIISITFSPVLIQFAHFGTTESLLALLYSVIVYFSLLSQKSKKSRDFVKNIFWTSLFCGIAIAAKVSSIAFCLVPLFVLCVKFGGRIFAELSRVIFELKSSDKSSVTETPKIFMNIWRFSLFLFFSCVIFVAVSLILSFPFSPHNVISNPEFLSSFGYERDVGTGRYIAFYTRQFLYELPLLFQLTNIFPYALGIFPFAFAVLGLFFAPWNKEVNLLRFSIIFFAMLTMPWYAKWTRFIAPIYPIIYLFVVFGIFYILNSLKKIKFTKIAIQGIFVWIIVAISVQGLGYLTIYKESDVRYVASNWIVNNIPNGATVLSETANVIDVPIPDPRGSFKMPDGYHINYISFDFYNIDENLALYTDYKQYLKEADYIFVPSRRIFYNHTCIDEKTGKFISTRHSPLKCAMLAQKYPYLKEYYENLFSGKFGFQKVAEFTSYPRISLFGKTIWEFPDEEAEETFTVFDHPVIRIYKRISARK